jgi:hypothetical protein
MPSLSHQAGWPDSGQTERFSSLCDVSSLFTRAQRKEKSVLAACTLSCQLSSPLLPSEIRAINNTLGEFQKAH